MTAGVKLQVLQSSESLASNQCVASFVPPALLVNSNIYKYMSELNAALAVREVKVRILGPAELLVFISVFGMRVPLKLFVTAG